MSYSNGFQTTHTFAAAAIAGGGELGRIAPPAPGLTGRLVAVTNVVTTGVTDTAGNPMVETFASQFTTAGDVQAPVNVIGEVYDDTRSLPLTASFCPLLHSLPRRIRSFAKKALLSPIKAKIGRGRGREEEAKVLPIKSGKGASHFLGTTTASILQGHTDICLTLVPANLMQKSV